jgi:uncharacterized Tic20 family protein
VTSPVEPQPSQPSQQPQIAPPPYGPQYVAGPPAVTAYSPAQADPRPWAAGAHAGSFLAAWLALGVLAPVLVLALKGNQSTFIRHHAYESLNFQLNTYMWLIAAFLFGVLTLGIGWISVVAVGVWYTIFVIVAARAANRGEWYRYPAIIRFFNP